jgi:hypothetical protein
MPTRPLEAVASTSHSPIPSVSSVPFSSSNPSIAIASTPPPISLSSTPSTPSPTIASQPTNPVQPTSSTQPTQNNQQSFTAIYSDSNLRNLFMTFLSEDESEEFLLFVEEAERCNEITSDEQWRNTVASIITRYLRKGKIIDFFPQLVNDKIIKSFESNDFDRTIFVETIEFVKTKYLILSFYHFTQSLLYQKYFNHKLFSDNNIIKKSNSIILYHGLSYLQQFRQSQEEDIVVAFQRLISSSRLVCHVNYYYVLCVFFMFFFLCV